MFKRVDVKEEVLEGWSYTNCDGNLEYVEIVPVENYVRIRDSMGNTVVIYYDDISLLTIALEAARLHNLHNN